MNGILGGMAFLNPWVLLGLLALPLLWILLRVFPPVPRLVRLPGAWLLEGLVPDRPVVSKTPWWILLLRTIIAALVLIGLAHPVLHPAESLNIKGDLRLVLDNGWDAAQTWNRQLDAADQILIRAGRDGKSVYLLTTAPEPGQAAPFAQGPMTAAQARTALQNLKPRPWPSDNAKTAALAERGAKTSGLYSVWIGTGLDEGDSMTLAGALIKQGGLSYMEPEAAQRPLLLQPGSSGETGDGTNISTGVTTAPGFPENMPVSIEVLAKDGRVLDQRTINLKNDTLPTPVVFILPTILRGDAAEVRLAGHDGAGATLLLQSFGGRKAVGVLTAREDNKIAPLMESGFYITRALEPYADITAGSLETLLKKKKSLSVIILPDIGAMPPDSLNALEDWVKGGGLLLRTAGPNMSKGGDDTLLPEPLRKGGRALDGAMTWEKPQKLAPFAKVSPFYGLDIPPDVDVRQQLLAEPVADLDKKTWAALQDGTPLVTAAPLGRGMLVLIHTAAAPGWSNLALSGLYVQMLRRVVGLAGQQDITVKASGMLEPQLVFDGLGTLNPPDSTALPIDAAAFDKQMPDSSHPPGLYGREGFTHILNLGARVRYLNPMPALPSGAARSFFTHGSQKDLMPAVLALAAALFLFDWLIMLALQGLGSFNPARLRRAAALILLMASLLTPLTAQADDPVTPDMVREAGALYLAYVRTGQANMDSVSQQGLDALAKTLSDRTSVEPAGAVAVDPAKDELAFFPLIYWPLSGNERPLSPGAAHNVQSYLDHGGTILFDTRDPSGTGPASDALKTLTANLDIPPLVHAPDNHVLTKSFYLLRDFPGRYDTGILWVEQQSASGRDGVSSVIVGGNDWASAWAGINPPDGSRGQEMALRFGVNLVMYALTGNYKADQVHVPYILERLGQ